MKPAEIEEILGMADDAEIRKPDFRRFSDPSGAEEIYQSLLKIKADSGGRKADFTPYFEDRIMNRIYAAASGFSLDEQLSGLLYRVAGYGLTAAALVLITFFLLYGQDAFSVFTGSDTSGDINFISYLFYDF